MAVDRGAPGGRVFSSSKSDEGLQDSGLGRGVAGTGPLPGLLRALMEWDHGLSGLPPEIPFSNQRELGKLRRGRYRCDMPIEKEHGAMA